MSRYSFWKLFWRSEPKQLKYWALFQKRFFLLNLREAFIEGKIINNISLVWRNWRRLRRNKYYEAWSFFVFFPSHLIKLKNKISNLLNVSVGRMLINNYRNIFGKWKKKDSVKLSTYICIHRCAIFSLIIIILFYFLYLNFNTGSFAENGRRSWRTATAG